MEFLNLFKIYFIISFYILYKISISLKNYEKVYITLTSWKARINKIYKTIEILLNNTVKPKKIILNLSIEEFPNKKLDLPKNIINLLKKYYNFEIFWVKKNNNVFKKLIPTLNRIKNDLIITVDDDVYYPKDMIENMLKCFKKIGSNNPVSFGSNRTDWNINGKIINSHYGAGSIVKYKFFKKKINEIYKYTTEDRINKGIKCFDDILYTYSALVNGYKYFRCKEYSIRNYVHNSPKLKNPFSKKIHILLKDYHNIIRKYIINKYNLTVEKLIEKIEKNENKIIQK